MALLFCLGIISRIELVSLPSWYINYAGDFLWAMLIFYTFALITRKPTIHILIISIVFTYLIEVSQLFHPPWLEYLRSIKLFAFILGFTFFWSDLIAYTLGIILASGIDRKLIKNNVQTLNNAMEKTRNYSNV